MSEFKISRLRFNYLGQWATDTFYNRDAVVSYEGKTYVCLEPHTSDTNASAFYDALYFFTPGGAPQPRWSIVINGHKWVGEWTPNTYLNLGNMVVYGGSVYICTVAHESTTSFNSDNFEIYASFSKWHPGWTANLAYGIGDVVKYGGIVYICTENHVSASTITLGLEDDIGLWSIVSEGIEYTGTWNSSNFRYKKNDIVKNGPDLWIANSGHTSTTNFDQTKWSIWLPGQEYVGSWSSSSIYQIGDVVMYGGYSYTSLVANNTNNVPSVEATDWELLTTGYNLRGEWSNGTSYRIGDVVRQRGNVFSAVQDNSGQTPTAALVIKNYVAAGSSGTTVNLSSTSGIVPGMVIVGAGASLGQTVVTVGVNSVELNIPLDKEITDGQALEFNGINYVYWELVIPGTKWFGFWTPSTYYVAGDIVVWKNSTYKCIASHDNSTNSTVSRPDADENNQYWITFIPHDRNNALTLQGDILTYSAVTNSTLSIGTTDQVLRATGTTAITPAWAQILVSPKVFYVATTGEDRADYGITWDRPWASINYACQFVGNGTENANARQALESNKLFVTTEMYNWMLYQKSQSIAPFSPSSVFGQVKTIRDAGFIIDAVVYDITRVGNSQTVAAALSYFKPDGSDSFFNDEVDAQMPFFVAALEFLRDLVVTRVLFGTPPMISYQELMGVPEEDILTMDTTYSAEIVSREEVASLMNLVINALADATTQNLPAPNQGISSTIFVKTGTYKETLPIVVPAQVAIVGDELRGVTVQPNLVINTFTTESNSTNKTFSAYSTEGMYDGCPVQFVRISSFVTNLTGQIGGAAITAGQTYYVKGSTLTPTSFQVSTVIGGAVVTPEDRQGFNQVVGGDAIEDMFRLRNGTGLRNMTLSGLLGTLTAQNEYFTQRPTGGAFASLDPGNGPNDTSAWIYRRSPYTQNCTMFGIGCSGMKVDGELHNGGNRSITANDFTCIISDGIGAWVTGTESKAELVSVFTYYCYTSYFAEDGGRIRATNGNSSYGSYGCIAEGFDIDESPITAKINNQSTEASAAVQQAFGTDANLLKLQYINAGVEYNQATTNLLGYSNDFLAAGWTTDGNVTLQQNIISPSGYADGWMMTGTTSITDSSYIYKDISITPTGATYSGLIGDNITGSGSGATFDVTVNATSYSVQIALGGTGGTGYVFGNKIRIYGSQVGGVDGTNDITLTVASLVGSTIITVTPAGTVPAGSALNYTASVHVKKGTAQYFDLIAYYTGATQNGSGILFNFDTLAITPYAITGGVNPIEYGVISLTDGWYRIWFTTYDTNALNDTLRFTLYPRGLVFFSGSSYVYGTQLEIGSEPRFYLSTTVGQYTAFADYIIAGAGVEAIIVADETRSLSVYESRITDPGAGAGGSGYLVASNNAQGGNESFITLAGADINTAANYNGMRLFINSGTGAGQFGVISDFNESSKIAYILKESIVPLAITATSSIDDTLTLSNDSDVNTLYFNQPVQFIPTYYSTTVTATSQSSVQILQAAGGLFNVMTATSTAGFYYNMAVTFSGTVVGGVVENFTYYIYEIVNSTTFKITSTPFGSALTLQTVTPTSPMFINIPSNTSYMTGSTTSMLANMPIQFTGLALGGVSTGDKYYINDVINATNFTISSLLITGNVLSTTSLNKRLGVTSASTLVPLNPIVFSGVALGALELGVKYYISKITTSSSFQVSDTLLVVNVTATEFGTNLITCSSTAGFVVDNPIRFTGNAFGNLIPEQTYFILAINDGTTFAIAPTVGASAVALNTATGAMVARTCPTSLDILDETGSMAFTTTSAKTTLTTSAGSMNAIFSTPIFGGINAGQTYYVKDITPGSPNNFTISGTFGGVVTQLTTGAGTMQMGEVGWDHVNSGTPAEPALDSTSLYFIEPRLIYSPPQFSQTATSLPPINMMNRYADIVYGDNFWMAVPNGQQTIALSDNGETWTSVTLPTAAETWSSVAYGNTAWVITADRSRTALYSFAKGQSWKRGTLPTASPWVSTAYGNGRFVSVASGRTYENLSGTNISGSGSGATFNVTATGTTYTATVATAGNASYAPGDTIRILGTALGGATTANDLTITVVAVGALTPGITTVSVSGTANSAGTSAYSTSYGASWTASALPGTGRTWSSVTYGSDRFVAIARSGTSAAYSVNNGVSWQASTLPDNANWSSVAYGNGRFVAVPDGRTFSSLAGTNIIGSGSGARFNVSTNGTLYSASAISGQLGSGYAVNDTIRILGTALGGATPANDLTITVNSIGGGALGAGSGVVDITVTGTAKVTKPAYSFDGITWYESPYAVSASSVSYGNGIFLATKLGSTKAHTSEDGLFWKVRTVLNQNYTGSAFGFSETENEGKFVTISTTGTGSVVFAGATTKGRPTVTTGIITAVTEFETGGNYTAPPAITLFDPNVTSVATISARIGSGVLSAPTFVNRGRGYNTSSTAVTINGSGYADQYQTGLAIVLRQLTRLPRPGDNLVIDDNDIIYKVTSASILDGTSAPNLTASIQISPSMSIALSPDHNKNVIIREKYSQVRLTNHDFLNVGYGDQPESGYPGLPAENTLNPQDQTIESNYGRVFYTSTDQDGNFKVGNLFGVEQATGIVTLSASQFGLSGLSQLSLGGIAVGGSSVVVTQFSTDGTFVANSDSILPTQKAIKSYLSARLSQGGSNTFTGNTTAGQVTIGGPNIINNTIPQGQQGSSVVMVNRVNFDGVDSGLIDGGLMALDFFLKNANRRG